MVSEPSFYIFLVGYIPSFYIFLVGECHIQFGPLQLTLCFQLDMLTLVTKMFGLQKPRVCILGGGFGGLYTALRLESLVWPDDKKPQVIFD